MKKTVLITILAAMGMTLTACGNADAANVNAAETTETTSANVNVGDAQSENVQIPSPFTEFDTIEEAEQLVGFDISVPDSIDGYGEKNISVMDSSMIQVMFRNDSDDITFRKESGSGDISGDHSEYSDVLTENIDGIDVTIKGNDGVYCDAIWENGGFAYSVFDRNGISKDDMLHYIGVMMTEDDGEIMVGGDPDTYSPFPID